MIAILHNIRSMHNVGSIFRTADAAGFKKLYLCGITPAPLDRFGRPNSKLLKVSLGAEQFLEWEQIKRTTALIDRLKKQHYTIIALELSPRAIQFNHYKPPHHTSEQTPDATQKIALIVGNEVKGLSPAILKRADSILEIPMRGKKESLNVSVAFGIIAYHLAMLFDSIELHENF